MAKKFNFAELDENLDTILKGGEKEEVITKASVDKKTTAKASENKNKEQTPKKEEAKVESITDNKTEVIKEDKNDNKKEDLKEKLEVSSSAEKESTAETEPKTSEDGDEFTFKSVVRRSRTVRKTMLLPPALSDKIRDKAKEYRISENELLNQLLEHYFK